MENKKELIQIIENQISTLEQYVSNFSIEDEEKVSRNKQIIENNLNQEEFNFNFLRELNLNELLAILPETFNNDLFNLDFYIKSLNTTKYGINMMQTPEVISHIKEILSKIANYLKEKEEKNNTAKESIASYQTKSGELNSLRHKIIDEQNLDETDIEQIFTVVDSIDDKSKAIDLLIAFGENLLREDQINFDNNEEEIEEYIENENKEEIENALINLFKKYNLEFSDFNPRDQKSLINYCNLELVDSILKLLKENDINLGEKYKNDEKIIILKSLAITEILLNGDVDVLKQIFELAKLNKILTNNNQKIDFMLLIENPSRFIKRKKRYYRKGSQTIGTGDNPPKETLIGCADDFIANFKFITSLGGDCYELLKHEVPVDCPHHQILNHQKLYEIYGIDKNYYLRALSCLYFNAQPADVIDQYIEIGFFDYFKYNMSVVNLGTDSLTCYKLLYAAKYTDLEPQNFFSVRNEKKGTKLVLNNKYLNSNPVIANMTSNNCYKLTDKYIPLSEQNNTRKVYETFNNAIAKSDNSDTKIALTRSDSIIPVLDEYFLARDINNVPIIPNIYKFGTVTINKADGQFLKNWDICISRNKVIRIYNTLMQQGITDNNHKESVMYAITKNSILTEVEYNIIYDTITKLMKRREL